MNKCSSFSAGCGYWKATGQDSQIMAPGTNRVIGMKKSLVFYKYNYYRGPAFKTQWVMHQYCIQNSLITPRLSYQVHLVCVYSYFINCFQHFVNILFVETNFGSGRLGRLLHIPAAGEKEGQKSRYQ